MHASGVRPHQQPRRKAVFADQPALLVILIVLYLGSQLASSVVMAFSADKTQRRIMFALPFVFVIFIINFQAG